jgi:cbb3-type cytochrome oxidase subunit 1
LQPWDASLDGSYPFWMIRLFAGLTIIAGQLCFVVNLWKTWRLSRSPATQGAAVTAVATA